MKYKEICKATILHAVANCLQAKIFLMPLEMAEILKLQFW